MEVENDEKIDLSAEHRAAVALAVRVVSLLDPKALYDSIGPSELEADEYDGSVSVAEWLRLKSIAGIR